MAEKVELNLLLKGGSKAIKTIGELEEGLAQAREEIKGVEKGSADFKKLATAIQDASSEVKTLEKQMEGLEPQQKAEAFLKMGEGIAGGFAVGQGAMALMGVESENLEKVQVKVQAAISIAMGVRMMSEAALMATTAKRVILEKTAALRTGALTVVTKLNTAANAAAVVVQKALSFAIGTTSKSLKVLKAAIVATGVGALVVGVTSLVSGISNWISGNKKASDSQKDLARETERATEKIQEQLDTSRSEADMKRELKNINDEEEKTLKKLENRLAKAEKMTDARVELQKSEVETIAAIKENLTLMTKAQQDEFIASMNLNNVTEESIDKLREKEEAIKDLIDAQKENIKKIKEDADEQKKTDDKNKAARDKRRQQRKDEAAELLALTQEVTLLMIEDEDKRAVESLKIQRLNALDKVKNHKNRKLMEKQINDKFDALEAKTAKEQREKAEKEWDDFYAKYVSIVDGATLSAQELEIKAVKDKYAELEKEAEIHHFNMATAKETMNKEIKAINDKYDKEAKEKAKATADEELGYRQEIMANYFQAAKDLGGENQKIQKGIAVAETIYNTQQAIMNAMANVPAPFNVPVAISTGVMGAAAIKNILTESMGDIGDVADPNVPSTMTPSASGAFTLAGAIEQEPVRAYVITDEISDSQEQLSDIRRRATI